MPRSDHQCHRTGCHSEAVAGVDVHLFCRAPGGYARLVKMRCSILTCEAHKPLVRGYVLADQNRETIRTTLMESGLPEPDFLDAKIEFVPIMPGAPIKVMPIIMPEVVGCDRAGCANPAKWRINQKFRAIWQGGKGEPRAEAMTNIVVCDHHKRKTKADDLLLGEDRERTRRFLQSQGLLLPDLDGMILEFVPLVVVSEAADAG